MSRPEFLTPPRLVLAFMALSLGAWVLPLWATSLILIGSIYAGLRLGGFSRPRHGKLRTYAAFICFWGLSAFMLQWLSADLSWQSAARNAFDLILRLTALAALTLNLDLLLTPFTLARVLAGGLRPVLGEERAQRIALALAVMLRLIPQAGHCLRTLRQALKLRGNRLPPAQRLTLLAGAALRHLSRLAWQQSLALAARDVHLAPLTGATPKSQKE